jgi:hypothetical protein
MPDDLFATLDGGALRTVTKNAVSHARQKLRTAAFAARNDRLTGLPNELLPEPHRQAQAACMDLIDKTPKLRMIKVVLSTGHIEVPALRCSSIGSISNNSPANYPNRYLREGTCVDTYTRTERGLGVRFAICTIIG